MAADLPENYAMYDDALQFIRDVPVDWADTRVLDAKVGDYIVTARKDKNSDNWYLGGITDEQQRTLTLSLDFLDEGSYQATIYRDGDKAAWDTYPTAYTIENISVTRDDELTITMARGGGFAISIWRE